MFDRLWFPSGIIGATDGQLDDHVSLVEVCLDVVGASASDESGPVIVVELLDFLPSLEWHPFTYIQISLNKTDNYRCGLRLWTIGKKRRKG